MGKWTALTSSYSSTITFYWPPPLSCLMQEERESFVEIAMAGDSSLIPPAVLRKKNFMLMTFLVSTELLKRWLPAYIHTCTNMYFEHTNGKQQQHASPVCFSATVTEFNWTQYHGLDSEYCRDYLLSEMTEWHYHVINMEHY